MKHFVITRIGIGIYNVNRLNKMIDLFSIITLPSLLNQSSQKYNLLIVIDSNMPSQCVKKLKNLILNKENLFVIPIDITNLYSVHSGSFDWVWDYCQDFIIKNNLISDLYEYIITSILDADDAWQYATVGLVENIFKENLNHFVALESSSGTYIKGTRGAILTISNGYYFFPHNMRRLKINDPYHSMSIFVVCRLSSGISACSSRHSAWPHFAKVVNFEEFVLTDTPQMWIYTRHNEGAAPWSDKHTRPFENETIAEFKKLFGLNLETINLWNQKYNKNISLSNFQGGNFKDVSDLIFKISILNKSIKILENDQAKLENYQNQRESLISQLNKLN